MMIVTHFAAYYQAHPNSFLAAPVHFYLDRYSLIEAQVPYGLSIEPIHFYCGSSSPDEFRLLCPIDVL